MVALMSEYKVPAAGETDSGKPDVQSEGASTDFDTATPTTNSLLMSSFAKAAPPPADSSQPVPIQSSQAQRDLNKVLNSPSSATQMNALGKGESAERVAGRAATYNQLSQNTTAKVKDLQTKAASADTSQSQSAGKGFMARQAFGLAAVGIAGVIGGAPAAQLTAIATAIPDAAAAVSIIGRGFGQDKGASYFASTNKKGESIGYGASSSVSALASAQPAMSSQTDRFIANLTRIPGGGIVDPPRAALTSDALNGFEKGPKVKLEDTPTFMALAGMRANVQMAASSIGLNSKALGIDKDPAAQHEMKMPILIAAGPSIKTFASV